MRILIALDGSEISEAAVRTVGTWSKSVPIRFDLLRVIHPNDIRGTADARLLGEIPEPENTELGGIPQLTSSQFGDIGSIVQDPAPLTIENRGQALDRARVDGENYLRTVAARFLANANSAQHIEFSEETAETIVAKASYLGADAIAMGTHGRTGITHVLVGSVAEKVMRRSQIPVILVGPNA